MERSESGFTLTELLVVLVIMPLIIGAIAAVVVTGLLNQKQVSSRLTDSTSAKLTSAYFVRDVESATFVDDGRRSGDTTNNTPPCGYNPTSEEYYDPFAASAGLGSRAACPSGLGHSDFCAGSELERQRPRHPVEHGRLVLHVEQWGSGSPLLRRRACRSTQFGNRG